MSLYFLLARLNPEGQRMLLRNSDMMIEVIQEIRPRRGADPGGSTLSWGSATT